MGRRITVSRWLHRDKYLSSLTSLWPQTEIGSFPGMVILWEGPCKDGVAARAERFCFCGLLFASSATAGPHPGSDGGDLLQLALPNHKGSPSLRHMGFQDSLIPVLASAENPFYHESRPSHFLIAITCSSRGPYANRPSKSGESPVGIYSLTGGATVKEQPGCVSCICWQPRKASIRRHRQQLCASCVRTEH